MTDAAPIHDAPRLTRYIETRYHARHRDQLPALVKLAAMVEDLHCDDDGVPSGLADLLAGMAGEMEAQMTTEELSVFPAIREGDARGITDPVAAMRANHASQARRLDRIRWLTRDMTPPETACTSWATLYGGVAEFVDDLTEHIRLETDVLVPAVEGATERRAGQTPCGT